MLLNRSKPKNNQSFGDYLEELGKRNGFRDIRSFKQYLKNISKKHYFMNCVNLHIVRAITGLFLELGIDQKQNSDCQKYLCFGCLDIEPKEWDWRRRSLYEFVDEKVWKFAEMTIHGQWGYPEFCERSFMRAGIPGDDPEAVRNQHCGISLFSTKSLGLDLDSRAEGLFFGDIYSRSEREEMVVKKIYPTYKAFLNPDKCRYPYQRESLSRD